LNLSQLHRTYHTSVTEQTKLDNTATTQILKMENGFDVDYSAYMPENNDQFYFGTSPMFDAPDIPKERGSILGDGSMLGNAELAAQPPGQSSSSSGTMSSAAGSFGNPSPSGPSSSQSSNHVVFPPRSMAGPSAGNPVNGESSSSSGRSKRPVPHRAAKRTQKDVKGKGKEVAKYDQALRILTSVFGPHGLGDVPEKLREKKAEANTQNKTREELANIAAQKSRELKKQFYKIQARYCKEAHDLAERLELEQNRLIIDNYDLRERIDELEAQLSYSHRTPQGRSMNGGPHGRLSMGFQQKHTNHPQGEASDLIVPLQSQTRGALRQPQGRYYSSHLSHQGMAAGVMNQEAQGPAPLNEPQFGNFAANNQGSYQPNQYRGNNGFSAPPAYQAPNVPQQENNSTIDPAVLSMQPQIGQGQWGHYDSGI
jgi:hypothetical protein